MKRKMKKIAVVGLFACALTVASFGAMQYSVASADGDMEPTISLIEGASLRLEETNGEETVGFGMRFKTMIPQSWLDADTEDTLVNPVIHTILLPTDMLSGDLTAETAEIGVATVLAEDVQDMKYTLANYPDYYIFNTVLTQIDEEDYSREISVRSYVTADNLSEPIYSPLVSTYATTARSVVQVADTALSQDIQYSTDNYSALEKYLITGIDVVENRNLTAGTTSNVRAKLAFREGTSDTVKAHLNKKYPLTYASDTENCVTVNENSGDLYLNTNGTANITVSNETLGFTETVAVTVASAPSNIIPIAESNLDLNQYQGATVETYNSQEVVAISINSPSTNVNGVYIKLPYFVNVDSSDASYNAQYFTLSIDYLMAAESSENTTNWRIQESSEEKGGLLIKQPTDTVAYSTNLADAKTAGYVTKDGEFKARVYIQDNHKAYNASATFYITEIKFDIVDLVEGDTFSWVNYGIATDELSNVTFDGVEVTDVATFNPTAKVGTLAFTATKNGVSSTHTIDVKPKSITILDATTNISNSINARYSSYELIEANGQQVISFTLNGTESTPWTGGVSIYLSEEELKFTSFSVTFVLASETQTGTANWRAYANSNYSMKDPNNMNTVTYTGDLASQIISGNELKAYVKIANEDHKANIQSATFYITEIKLSR